MKYSESFTKGLNYKFAWLLGLAPGTSRQKYDTIPSNGSEKKSDTDQNVCSIFVWDLISKHNLVDIQAWARKKNMSVTSLLSCVWKVAKARRHMLPKHTTYTPPRTGTLTQMCFKVKITWIEFRAKEKQPTSNPYPDTWIKIGFWSACFFFFIIKVCALIRFQVCNYFLRICVFSAFICPVSWFMHAGTMVIYCSCLFTYQAVKILFCVACARASTFTLRQCVCVCIGWKTRPVTMMKKQNFSIPNEFN